MENQGILYIFSGALALVPAAIWLSFLLKKGKRKSIQIIIFSLSIFSVVPVFILQYFVDLFPQFNILEFLQSQIHNQNANYILLFISVGIVEEIVKQAVLRLVDRKYLLIQTINDSIHYSLIGALGFAFAENIFYIYAIYTQLGIQQLIVPYLFRSIFTTTAHLLFSGFFGYYYGIAKFSLNITEQTKWMGKKQRFANFLGSIMNMPRLQAIKEITILKGLGIAIALHATFNFLLQFNQILPVVIFIICGFSLLLYKLKQKSGKLILVTDVSEQRASTMAKKDQDVVVELLGMWFNDKRYVDVIHICERLMQRDPDNKIIQLFKAKALDKIDQKSAYGKILKNIFPDKEKSSISSLVNEKTELSKKPQQIIELTKPSSEEKPKKESDTFNLHLGQ
ncbi:PrsW family intramembrane metalloprotease [Patescibacteria group bacterium]|nr:PrsW family intramembrane metalloprotease [Patescibacteria group bacterium]MBU1702929.1 PrsW family intramembrane metalloprotease [Patescibacteria group bacterium]MBU1953481.1 PrsW family intramembrane metalloprotease [Patescibacteria group bacterium]